MLQPENVVPKPHVIGMGSLSTYSCQPKYEESESTNLFSELAPARFRDSGDGVGDVLQV
jgi:hypothetical protein